MKFKEFLREDKGMTLDQALKVFGLTSIPSVDDLSTKRKTLARQFHTDLGSGNTEKMQEVNRAYDVIADALKRGGSVASSRINWEEIDKKYEAAYYIVHKAVGMIFKAQPFEDHFKRIFGEPFVGEIVRSAYSHSNSGSVWFTGTFDNDSKTIVLTMTVTIDYSPMTRATLGGGSNSIENLTLNIYTTILANRRKVKLSKRDYAWKQAWAAMTNPEITFPTEKLKESVGKAAARKMSKRDVLLTLSRELGAHGDENYMWIPLNPAKTITLCVYRMTMQGLASWGINGIYESSSPGSTGKRVYQGPVMFMPETEKCMNWFIDSIKHMKQTCSLANEFNFEVGGLAIEYKRRRDEFYEGYGK
jgi:curved DNA-binding protein CbpA